MSKGRVEGFSDAVIAVAITLLVLDIQDHSLTFGPFTGAVKSGAVSRRRLTPIVDWETAGKVING